MKRQLAASMEIWNNQKIIPLFLMLLLSCQLKTNNDQGSNSPQSSPKAALDNNYTPTEPPIRLEKLSEEARELIDEANRVDTSSYLINTRPVVFQIQGVQNDQNETRYAQRINRNVEVSIYSIGEAEDTSMVDYGWIENEQGEVIWKMTFENSSYAGGANRNRKSMQSLPPPAGIYRLRYISNDHHANEDWEEEKPENEFYYGITVFNIQAIKEIKRKIKEEQIPMYNP